VSERATSSDWNGLTLIIGSKNLSSWSLRPWLAMKQAGIAFEEVLIQLDEKETDAKIARYSPSGFVPVLLAGGLKVWDSLAICEYVAERFPEAGLWPSEAGARALARSVSAEMHAGFAALRRHLPLECKAFYAGFEVPTDARADINRILALWTDCRERYGKGGEMLFGRFTVADAMYAPVVLRFATYDVRLEGGAADYVKAVRALPAVREWLAAAQNEPAPSVR